MRNFLTDINIVGTTCIWSEGDICRPCIENLIEHCDKVVLCRDNSDDYTKAITEEYVKKYPDIVIAKDNSLPPIKKDERIMSRHKHNRGELREEALKMVKIEHDKRPIDLLIFPDSDEVFTTNFPNLITEFWASTVDTLFIRPLEVFMNMHIIANNGLVAHARIYKYVPEITALPYSQQTFYLPYRLNRNIWKRPWNYIHIARLTEKNRDLRQKLRGGVTSPDLKLRRVSRPANELTPKEGWDVMNSEKFLRLKDFDGDINKIPLIL